LPISNESNNDVDVFEQTDSAKENELTVAPGEIILGTIISIDALGQPMVDYPLNPDTGALKAITTLALTSQHISRQVALLFNQGNLSQPIVMGFIHSPLQSILDNFEQTPDVLTQDRSTISEDHNVELSGHLDTDNVCVDGNKIIFEAQDEMVFKCGKSSITLTKEGKVMIRGKYLLNRSSGVNRIMGGSVQVN
jgi:hypothetical protein